MNLEEAIKHCEEVAEKQEKRCSYYKEHDLQEYLPSESECAKEHRQLADWLKKLKAYEDGVEIIKEQMNDLKCCDMWDIANGMAFALELLGVKEEVGGDAE